MVSLANFKTYFFVLNHQTYLRGGHFERVHKFLRVALSYLIRYAFLWTLSISICSQVIIWGFFNAMASNYLNLIAGYNTIFVTSENVSSYLLTDRWEFKFTKPISFLGV